MIKVAKWVNGLGEVCTSQVYAEFDTSEGPMIVVRNWRRSALGVPYEVRSENECEEIYEEE